MRELNVIEMQIVSGGKDHGDGFVEVTIENPSIEIKGPGDIGLTIGGGSKKIVCKPSEDVDCDDIIDRVLNGSGRRSNREDMDDRHP